ncbi:ribonuclease III [Candidatus Microgenomates bacterium]|nr:ribonuclease III [Candidatus Microgenomates bacterium]
MTLNDFKKKLNLSFKEKKLIDQAFVHRSYLNETKVSLSSNERLEFLGDAVLEFLISSFLYQNFPNKREGELTNLRAAIVCTKTLSEIAKQLGLGELLKLSKGEEKEGGRENPSILADTFEALLGAIYIDGDISQAKDFLEKAFYPYIQEIISKKNLKDPKSLFQEMIQEKIKTSPDYQVLEEKGPDHSKKFKVGVFVDKQLYGTGTGKSKQKAEEVAAKTAIEKISNDSHFLSVAKRKNS